MAKESDASDEKLFEGLAPEDQLECLYDTPLSYFSLLIATMHSGAIWTFVAVAPLYGLAAIGALDDTCFPEPIQQPTHVSGIPVLVRLIYLTGPMTALISIGVYLFVKVLERIVRLKSIHARLETHETRELLATTIDLVERRVQLSEQVTNWHPGDPDYDAYSAIADEASQKKQELLGPLRATLLTHFGIVAFNWYAIGLQFYYGVRWGLCSYWLAIPILVIWIIGITFSSLSLIRKLSSPQLYM